MGSPMKRGLRWLLRAVLLLVGGAVALLLAEGVMRLIAPLPPDPALIGGENPAFRRGGAPIRALNTTDPDLGYRPVLGRGGYNAFGTLVNAYEATKPPGVTRLLFLGDSVTRRGRIVAALAARYGRKRYEYWNGGVEGYNVVQEVIFYEKFQCRLRPDHVILTFHNNDFGTVPVAFVDARGNFVVCEPGRRTTRISRWLFLHSHLYRRALHLFTEVWFFRDEFVAETAASLARLRDRLRADGIRFTVLVHPVLKPQAAWTDLERRNHRDALALMRRLGLRHYDLLVPLRAALRDGVAVQETPGDPWHPSAAAAAYFADYLVRCGLLAPGG